MATIKSDSTDDSSSNTPQGIPGSAHPRVSASNSLSSSTNNQKDKGTQDGTQEPLSRDHLDQTEVHAIESKHRWHVRREVKLTISVLLLFFIGEYILLPELAVARRDFYRLDHLNFLWIIFGVALEGLALAAYAQLTHTVLSPNAPRRFRLFRINMWTLAVSHVLPGGTVPGTAVSYRLLTESGVPGATAGFGLATQGVGSAVVLNGIFWIALIVSIPLNGFNKLYGLAALLGVILIGAFAFSVFTLIKGKHKAADFLYRIATHIPIVNADKVSSLVQHLADRLEILLKDRSLLYRALIWASVNWIADAGSLWIFLFAFGARVSPIDLLVAYGLANILAVIPITPGGLGVVEFTLISVMTGFGIPGSIATAGVLGWRLVNFWLPIPLGGFSYLSLRFGPTGRQIRVQRNLSAS